MKLSKKDFAVFESGSKQYKVHEGDVISVEFIDNQPGSTLTIDNVLLISSKGKAKIGQPYLKDTLTAEVVAHEKDKKVTVFKFKKKTGFKKKQGHRQAYTTIKINSIGSAKKTTAKAKEVTEKATTATSKTKKKEDK
ncbi:50S ribosomal protein L21 [Candidatus Marinamargulisbacteria bacterium SCGC AG-414-C22]|nr:50S ribosomal protein L21 [Candidatus Marinamargulisbacteria bacterium SCGC AG-414-C22]